MGEYVLVVYLFVFVFFKQKTAYDMRISDWSSDVCSSDLDSGDLRLWRVVEVVEVVEDYFKQIDAKAAQKLQPGAKIGDFIVDPLPPIDLGRIDAQSAKQVIFQQVRDAERERQYEEFKDRVGEIITGAEKSAEFGQTRKSTRLN